MPRPLLCLCLLAAARAAIVTTVVEPDEGSLARSMPIRQMAMETPQFRNLHGSALLEHDGAAEGAVRCRVRKGNYTVTDYVAADEAAERCVDATGLLQETSARARVINQVQTTVAVNGVRKIENRIVIFCSSASPTLQLSLPNNTQISVRCQAPDILYRAPVVGLVPAASQAVRARVRDSKAANLSDAAEAEDTAQTLSMMGEETARFMPSIFDYVPALLEHRMEGPQLLQLTTPPPLPLPTTSLSEADLDRLRATANNGGRWNTWSIVKVSSYGASTLIGAAGTVALITSAGLSAGIAGPLGVAVIGAVAIIDMLIPNQQSQAILEIQKNLIKVVETMSQVIEAIVGIERRRIQMNEHLLTFVGGLDQRLELTNTIANANREDIKRLSATLETFSSARTASFSRLEDDLNQVTGQTAELARTVAEMAQESRDMFDEVFKLIRYNFRTIDQVRRYVDFRIDERDLNNALLNLMYRQIQAYLDWNARDPDLDPNAREQFALYGKFKLFTEEGHWDRIRDSRPVNSSNPAEVAAFRDTPITVSMTEHMFSIRAVGGGHPRAMSVRLALRCTSGFWLDLPPESGFVNTIIESIGSEDCNPAVSTPHGVCDCWVESTEFLADQKAAGSVIDSPEMVDSQTGEDVFSLQQLRADSAIVNRGSLVSTVRTFATTAGFTTYVRDLCLRLFAPAGPDRIVQGQSHTHRFTTVTQYGILDESYPDSLWPSVDCSTDFNDVGQFFDEAEAPANPHFRNPLFARWVQGTALGWRLVAAMEAPELLTLFSGHLSGKSIHLNTVAELQTPQSNYAAKYGMVGASFSRREKTGVMAFVSSNTLYERLWTMMEKIPRVTVTTTSDSSVADAVANGEVRIYDASVSCSHELPNSFRTLGTLAKNDWTEDERSTTRTYVVNAPQGVFGHGYTRRSREHKINYFSVPPVRSLETGKITWRDDTDFATSPPSHKPFNYNMFAALDADDDDYVDPRGASMGPQQYMQPIRFSNNPAVKSECYLRDPVRMAGVTPCSLWSSFDIEQRVRGDDDRNHVFAFVPVEWEARVELIIPADADVVEELRSQCPTFVDPRVGNGNLTGFGVFGRVGQHRVFVRNENPNFSNTLTIKYTQQFDPDNSTNAPLDPLCSGSRAITLEPGEERFIDLGVSLCPSLSVYLSTYDGNPCDPVVGLSISTLQSFEDDWSYAPLDLIGGTLEGIAQRIIRDANRDVIQEAEIQIANYTRVTNGKIDALNAIVDVLERVSFEYLPEQASALEALFRDMAQSIRNSSSEVAAINSEYRDIRNRTLPALSDAWRLLAENKAALPAISAAIQGVQRDLKVLQEANRGVLEGFFDTSDTGSIIQSVLIWVALVVGLIALVCFCLRQFGRAASGGSAETTRLLKRY